MMHPFSILMFNKLTAMKSEDADPAILQTPMEEIMVQLMEATYLAKLTLLSLDLLLMEDGHFNGLGLEELLL
jgi:hypothetical protein